MGCQIISFVMNLATMPKAELHLHLEGSARYATLREALSRHAGTDLPESPYWLEPDFRFESFDQFRLLFRDYLNPWLAAPSGYSEMIDDVVDSVIAQNIRYAEINFCPNVIKRVEAGLEEVLGLLGSARARASGQGTFVRWIAGLNRDEGVEETTGWIQRLVGDPVVDGFDLHGTEPGWPPDLFEGAFAPVLEAGLKLKIHAGEMVGPESVRGAIEVLAATQIGHGTTAIRDPETVALLRERGTVVEMCPTSNERLRNVASYEDHPILDLDSKGVKITVSSDDSLFTGANLTQELGRLVVERGVTMDDLVRWTRNALGVALLETHQKEEIESDLEEWLKQQ